MWLQYLGLGIRQSLIEYVHAKYIFTRNVIYCQMSKGDMDWCRYSDLVLYFPMNFLSVYLIERFGLKLCVVIGSIIMIVGSIVRMSIIFDRFSLWWWFLGHIITIYNNICMHNISFFVYKMSSSALLKTPATKLASNWFGDKERGFATAIGIISIPCGIFISKVMTMLIFDDKDKLSQALGGNPYDVTYSKYQYYVLYQCIISIVFVLPSLILININDYFVFLISRHTLGTERIDVISANSRLMF